MVHVVDDDAGVRMALGLLLRAARLPAAAYPSGAALLEALSERGPDRAGCVVTDVRMPDMDGIELMRRLREDGCRWPVIIITGHGDVPTAVRAIKEGALDFVEKPFRDEALLGAVRAALAAPGEARPAAAEAARLIADLSPREREVMDLLVQGKPNKVVASELGLSPRTVEAHRARLMARIGVSSLAEVVRLSVRAAMG
jgi:two-component system response regulator FixJ